jgi:hypothetical protein
VANFHSTLYKLGASETSPFQHVRCPICDSSLNLVMRTSEVGQHFSLYCMHDPGILGYQQCCREAVLSLQGVPVRLRVKWDDTRAETRFRLPAKRTSPFKSAGWSVQSTTGRRAVHISLQGLYCSWKPVFCSHMTLIGYPLHSLVASSLLHPCVTVCHHIPNAVCVVRYKATTEKRYEFMLLLRWTCWRTEKGLETLFYLLFRRQLYRMSAWSPNFLGFISGFPPFLLYNSEHFSLEGVTPVSLQVGVISGICSLVREKVSEIHLWRFMTLL